MSSRSPTGRRGAPQPRGRLERGDDVAARASAVSAHLKQRGFKRSSVRDAVIEEFLRAGRHVSIEELVEMARSRVPEASYSTAYRTLRILVDHGFAAERDFGGGRTLFEPADTRHHDHIVCTECGEVREFEDPAIEELQENVARRLEFEITAHRLELFGLCRACAAAARGR